MHRDTDTLPYLPPARVSRGPHRFILPLLALCAAALLAGCATTRPGNVVVCDNLGPTLDTPSRAAPAEELDVLLLSAGGPWGAFGVGFLDGWSGAGAGSIGPRPPFDIAIGISTGAMMVTHAFLGSDYDQVLREQVATLTTEDVFRPRTILTTLFANAATETEPLRRRLERAITEETLDRVADAWLNEGRRLAVIAVDLDCGNPETLDLTAVALQRDDPARRERYIDYIMASAASPVAFPPVFIDGHMMVDGALRQHIPFPGQIVEMFPPGTDSDAVRVNLYAVINSPLETYPLCVTDHVLYIAVRISDVWTGERAADSVALTVLDAQRRGWTVKYVAPMDGPCSEIPPPEDYFQQTFMRCQYEYGYQVATGESSPWRDSVDTLPNADPVHGAHPCRK
jgi:predicted acylesterase/phospholipase RssA